MGITEAVKKLHQYENDVEKDIKKLMERLQEFEEENVEKLKEFLQAEERSDYRKCFDTIKKKECKNNKFAKIFSLLHENVIGKFCELIVLFWENLQVRQFLCW